MKLEHPKAPAESTPDLSLTPQPDMPGEPSTSVEGGEPGRIERATAWGKRSARKAGEVADRERQRHVSVDVGFRTAERQRRVAAMVLAGGIAYRIFFWLLAVSVVVGGYLVLWTGYTCNKALSLAHATIWGVSPPKLEKPLRASLRFSGYTLGFIAAMAAARYVREQSQIGGFAATMLVLGVAFGLWLLASHNLPNAASGWLALMPGAVVFAVGLQALNVFTVYFLGPKLASATQLYGILGVVTTLLFWFYLGGRLIVAAATLDVEFTELRAAKRFPAEG